MGLDFIPCLRRSQRTAKPGSAWLPAAPRSPARRRGPGTVAKPVLEQHFMKPLPLQCRLLMFIVWRHCFAISRPPALFLLLRTLPPLAEEWNIPPVDKSPPVENPSPMRQPSK